MTYSNNAQHASPYGSTALSGPEQVGLTLQSVHEVQGRPTGAFSTLSGPTSHPIVCVHVAHRFIVTATDAA